MKRTIRYYRKMYLSMVISPNITLDRFSDIAVHVFNYAEVYLQVQRKTGVPALFTALLHCMEGNADYYRQILNGQPFTKKTTIHPKGKGPWETWNDSAIEAFKIHGLKKVVNTPYHILQALERWNGLGYEKHGIHSPYLWAGTNHYSSGKFIKDGIFSPDAKSKQIGAAIILRHLILKGPFPSPDYELPIRFDKNGELIHEAVCLYQEQLNDMAHFTGADRLQLDGWAGNKTSELTYAITGSYLPGDPRR
jgi:lysozyme family protein